MTVILGDTVPITDILYILIFSKKINKQIMDSWKLAVMCCSQRVTTIHQPYCQT